MNERRWTRSPFAFGLRGSLLLSPAIAGCALVAGLVAPADARITRIDIKVAQSPTFEGTTFGSVGAYEKLKGRAYGEIDPNDPRNAVIVDVKLAPRNARGMVEYATDVMILRPIDRAKGNGKIFFELNNRGGLLTFAQMNDAAADTNDPSTPADAARKLRDERFLLDEDVERYVKAASETQIVK